MMEPLRPHAPHISSAILSNEKQIELIEKAKNEALAKLKIRYPLRNLQLHDLHTFNIKWIRNFITENNKLIPKDSLEVSFTYNSETIVMEGENAHFTTKTPFLQKLDPIPNIALEAALRKIGHDFHKGKIIDATIVSCEKNRFALNEEVANINFLYYLDIIIDVYCYKCTIDETGTFYHAGWVNNSYNAITNFINIRQSELPSNSQVIQVFRKHLLNDLKMMYPLRVIKEGEILFQNSMARKIKASKIGLASNSMIDGCAFTFEYQNQSYTVISDIFYRHITTEKHLVSNLPKEVLDKVIERFKEIIVKFIPEELIFKQVGEVNWNNLKKGYSINIEYQGLPYFCLITQEGTFYQDFRQSKL